jgi:lipopolysaccharide biosynthesis regulator YciM
LRSSLERNPSLLGLEQLLELRRSANPGAAESADLALSAALIKPQASRLARFVCSQCGFKARRHYWQCPGCSRWDTYAPRRTEELGAEAGA